MRAFRLLTLAAALGTLAAGAHAQVGVYHDAAHLQSHRYSYGGGGYRERFGMAYGPEAAAIVPGPEVVIVQRPDWDQNRHWDGDRRWDVRPGWFHRQPARRW